MKITRRRLQRLLSEAAGILLTEGETASKLPTDMFTSDGVFPVPDRDDTDPNRPVLKIPTDGADPALIDYLKDGLNDLDGAMGVMGNVTEDFSEFVIMPRYSGGSWVNMNKTLNVANSPAADVSTANWPGEINKQGTVHTIVEPAYSVKSTHVGTLSAGSTFGTSLRATRKLVGHALQEKGMIPGRSQIPHDKLDVAANEWLKSIPGKAEIHMPFGLIYQVVYPYDTKNPEHFSSGPSEKGKMLTLTYSDLLNHRAKGASKLFAPNPNLFPNGVPPEYDQLADALRVFDIDSDAKIASLIGPAGSSRQRSTRRSNAMTDLFNAYAEAMFRTYYYFYDKLKDVPAADLTSKIASVAPMRLRLHNAALDRLAAAETPYRPTRLSVGKTIEFLRDHFDKLYNVNIEDKQYQLINIPNTQETSTLRLKVLIAPASSNIFKIKKDENNKFTYFMNNVELSPTTKSPISKSTFAGLKEEYEFDFDTHVRSGAIPLTNEAIFKGAYINLLRQSITAWTSEVRTMARSSYTKTVVDDEGEEREVVDDKYTSPSTSVNFPKQMTGLSVEETAALNNLLDTNSELSSLAKMAQDIVAGRTHTVLVRIGSIVRIIESSGSGLSTELTTGALQSSMPTEPEQLSKIMARLKATNMPFRGFTVKQLVQNDAIHAEDRLDTILHSLSMSIRDGTLSHPKLDGILALIKTNLLFLKNSQEEYPQFVYNELKSKYGTTSVSNLFEFLDTDKMAGFELASNSISGAFTVLAVTSIIYDLVNEVLPTPKANQAISTLLKVEASLKKAMQSLKSEGASDKLKITLRELRYLLEQELL